MDFLVIIEDFKVKIEIVSYVSFLLVLSASACQHRENSSSVTMTVKSPIIIAHRGAQSIYPEHTLEAYKKAIELGADFIEPDLVMTKDGILISRHEPYISGTTDVEKHLEFADLKTTKMVDGNEITDWFVSDFTLAQIKTLRAKQARPERSKEFDGQFQIATFQEIINLAQSHTTQTGNPLGIYPELKHPTFHEKMGLEMVVPFLVQIKENGFDSKEAPIYVQCFEVETLQELRKKSTVRLVQLIGATGISAAGELQFTKSDGSWDSEGAPFDFRESGNRKTYQWFATEEGMQFVATYADAIGPWKAFVIPYGKDSSGKSKVLQPTDFVEIAHKNGIEVHPYTFRDEDTQWRENHDAASEYILFANAGIDGLFTDHMARAVKALRGIRE